MVWVYLSMFLICEKLCHVITELHIVLFPHFLSQLIIKIVF